MFRILKAYLFGYQPEEPTLSALSLKIYGDHEAQLADIYDGDTWYAQIHDYPPIIGDNVLVRINGIDCPELKDPRAHIKKIAVQAKEVAGNTLRSANKIHLKNMQRDKYFRILADVYADEIDVAAKLLSLKLAKPYTGGAKLPW